MIRSKINYNKEFDTMSILRNIYMMIISTLMVVLVVSCTSVDYDEQSTEEPVAAELPAEEDAPNKIVVTGSRIGHADRMVAERARGDSSQRMEVPRNPSPMLAVDAEAKRKDVPEKTISWKPSSEADNNAVIKLGRDEKLNPEALDISVQIDGFRARVVIDGFYTNPHDRNLEGSFKFRLPNGAVPYFFAFGETATSLENDFESPIIFDDSDKSLSRLSPKSIMDLRSKHWLAPKEAIMVSKEKAAFAYNDTVARQVDPALLEWAGAGIFSAKVFPLQAKKTHRVVLGYDLDLQRNGGDLMFNLPITKESIQKRINLFINKKGADKIVVNRIVNDDIKSPVIISKNNELVQETLEGTELNGIRITVKQHANVALLGEDDSGSYFAKQWRVELPTEASRSQPRAVFVLDTSLSALPEKFHLWIELIKKILINNKSEIKEFALLSFNTDSHWWKKSFVKNSEKQRDKLFDYLNNLILEGATDLASALDNAASPKWLLNTENNANRNNLYDLFLLSDGAITWGEKEAFFISESIKNKSVKHKTINQIYTYRLGQSGENAGLLTHLTREIGGGSYQLSNDTDLNQLATAHKMVPWKIESLKLKGAKDILIGGRPSSVYSGQVIKLAGRVAGNIDDDMVLTFSKNGDKKSVIVPMNNKIDSNLTSRVFGQIAVAQLESIAALERKVASAFANHFRVPGKSSSLLMLESEADYKRYNIKPTADAYVAGHKQVEEIFNKLNNAFASDLSDPKKRLMDQITKLEKIKILKFSLPDAISILLEDMPGSAFEIEPNHVMSNKIDKNRIPTKYINQLQPDKIKYNVLQKEANRRFKRYTPQDALKVLSSLIEQAPSDVAIIRDVAFAAESWGLYQQAFNLHLTAANLRPFEPQSYTYLAKLAHQLGKSDLALIYFEIGLASQWSSRFGDYALIHKIDYANFLRKKLESSSSDDFYANGYSVLKLKTLSKEINLIGSDLIVAISWNTDRTDIDLHVIEPSGEECYYQHNKTRSNGYITQDVTQGYGPEMYVNKKAPKGKYDLLVKYFSSDRNKLGLKTKVLVRTIRNWGTDKEIEKTQTVTLESQEEKQRIAKIKI